MEAPLIVGLIGLYAVGLVIMLALLANMERIMDQDERAINATKRRMP